LIKRTGLKKAPREDMDQWTEENNYSANLEIILDLPS
jgi:hypothetical protein